MQKNKNLIENTISILSNSGKIIGFPTDTVYGMGCDAFNLKAINKIYKLKGREKSKPLILFIKNISELDKYVQKSIIGLKLAKAFWPGALTIIFKAKSDCPVQASNKTIAIRIPDNETILSILKKYPNPIATTSANLEGSPPPLTHSQINLKLDFITPGRSGNIPSTIIDISVYPPIILREGKISRKKIESVIGKKFK